MKMRMTMMMRTTRKRKSSSISIPYAFVFCVRSLIVMWRQLISTYAAIVFEYIRVLTFINH